MVETVNLQMSGFATHGGKVRTYLLATKGILKKLGTLLVLTDGSEPMVGIVLLYAVVACDPVAPVVDILCVSAQLSDLLVLYTSHVLGRFCNVSENLRCHYGVPGMTGTLHGEMRALYLIVIAL